jgi:hypothetical protein
MGTINQMDMSFGRKAFTDQLKKIIGNFPQHSLVDSQKEKPNGEENDPASNPIELFQQETLSRFKPRLQQLETYQDKKGKQTLFAVIDGDLAYPKEQMHKIKRVIDPQNALELEILDRATFETIQRLCKAGILSFNQDQAKMLYQSQVPDSTKNYEHKKRLQAAQKYRATIERKERMATLLIEGEFYEEALVPLREVFYSSLKALAVLEGATFNEKEAVSLESIQHYFEDQKDFPKEAFRGAQYLLQVLTSNKKISELTQYIHSITQFLEAKINQFSLDVAA